MRKGFVITENYRRLAEALAATERRGAAEAGLVVVRGPYGVGKSKIVERWALDNKALFVRCKDTWTKRAMLQELAIGLGQPVVGSNSEVQARIIGSLGQKMVPILLDEADFLIRSKGSLLECVRDITDVTGCVCFLVAMDQTRKNFVGELSNRYPHILSRVNRIVDFRLLGEIDMKLVIDQLCEVPLAPDTLPFLFTQCQGSLRLLRNAIANIEQWASANGWARVEASHIKGRQLCTEVRAARGAA